MRAMYSVDKQYRFLPTSFSFDTDSDQEACDWAFEAIIEEIFRALNVTVDPWSSQNDCSNAALNIISKA